MANDRVAEPFNERIVDLYERHAAAWIRQRGRHMMEGPWLDRFTADLNQGSSILDLGAGSGFPIAAELIERGYRVTGVDASPTLMREAAAALPYAVWHIADMRMFASDTPFDGVLAWHSFFHLSPQDQEAMISNFARLSRSGGRLMFTAGPAHGVSVGEWEGEPLYHGSLDPAEYRRLLDNEGFAVIEHCSEDPDCGGATVWLTRRR